MGLTAANIGCGSVKPESWANFDLQHWDVRQPPKPARHGVFRSAVMNHVLCALDHHELVPALENVRMVLQSGGRLRVMVPDAMEAFYAYMNGDEEWFPQDDRTGDIDAKFCTYVTWFGTHKSIFTRPYLEQILLDAGYVDVQFCRYQQTWGDWPGITELDDRESESIFVEAVAP